MSTATSLLSHSDLLTLVESGKQLAARVELKGLLDDILSRVAELTDSQGASVLLQDERSGQLYFAAALGPGADGVLAEYGEATTKRVPLHSKAGVVFQSGQSLVEQTLRDDEGHFKGVDQETRNATTSLVCAAMTVQDAASMKRIGVLQIINRRQGLYGDRDRLLLEHFAAQAAIAIRNSKLIANLVAHMGFYSALDPISILNQLNAPPTSEPITVMFADMRGFTRLCQTIGSESKICTVLTQFITMLADEVLAHGGMVNKKLGDGVLALFRGEDTPRRAVECAFNMATRFDELREGWLRTLPQKIDFVDIGIGIVSDDVMLGTIGAGAVRDFTAIGTPVILAAALEKAARSGKRILSDRKTFQLAGELVDQKVSAFELSLHKPDQPSFTSYDVYELRRNRKVAGETSDARAKVAFLCHASEDKPIVRKLHERLCADGIGAWLDERAIKPGEEWARVIPDAVRTSNVAIVCISQHAKKEGYIQREIREILNFALEKPPGKVYVIPLRLEDCEIPSELRKWQRIDLFAPDGYQQLIECLNDSTST